MRVWVIAAAVASLYWIADWTITRDRGLTRVDTGDSISWQGAWEIPARGFYTLAFEGDGPSSWLIDGELALQVDEGKPSYPRIVWLEPGFHSIKITHKADAAPDGFGVTVARGDARAHPLDARHLKPKLPRNPWLRKATVAVRWILGWAVLALIALAIRRTVGALRARFAKFGGRDISPAWDPGRIVAWIVLAGILTWGALLRIDAITVRYGVVTSPAWMQAIQTRTILPPLSIRHPWFPWIPAELTTHPAGPPSKYFSDPYTYLQDARKMRGPYEAQEREPVFGYTIHLLLKVFNNQDVTVSFASTLFALLAIWLTYLFGASLWSRFAGLIAALALAIDRDAAWLASQGWRDDAYVAMVALGGWAIVHCWRSWRREPRAVRVGRFNVDAAMISALMLGGVAGLLILTRIMAFAFLVPAGIVLVLATAGGWRRRLALGGTAALVAILVACPYFINCWREFGDPLYTFNVHGNIYSIAEGQGPRSGSTLGYIKEKLLARPYTSFDTIARGVTVYPYFNKWAGLEAWRDGLGGLASGVAAAGLALLAFFPAGRLFLLIAFTSLLPFSLTWRVDPNPRFTAHLYPFLLIAAAIVIDVAARLMLGFLDPARRPRVFPRRAAQGDTIRGRAIAVTASALVVIGGAAWWLVERVSPQLVLAETLRHHEDGAVPVGAGPTAFTGAGWLPGAVGFANVRLRVTKDRGTLTFRLPEVDDYRVTVRLESFPRPLGAAPDPQPEIEVRLNGQYLGTEPLEWDPDRVGAIEVTLPRSHVRAGMNELTLVLRRHPGQRLLDPIPGLSEGDAFGVWLARIHRLPR